MAVTDTQLTVSGPALPNGTANGVIISTLSRRAIWTGAATVEAPEQDPFGTWEGWTLVRTDNTGWLADGFLEGQWVEICDQADTCGRFKVQLIRGTNRTKDNELELRFVPDGLDADLLIDFEDSLAAFVDGTFDVVRIAAVAHFDDDNWFEEQEIVLQADVFFRVPISRDGVKVFPASTHGLWKLLGPVAVEGGVTGADRSLTLGLKLPGEADGPLFKIGTQPPESKQIDVLNIFNDGSKENRTGTMTSTTLSGLGLPDDLDFGPSYSSGNPQTFGEPQIFPGGISYGTVQFVDGTFTSDGAKSTIEVLNLMLGIGNDALDIQGTLDPDDAVKLTGTIDISPTATGIDLTRPKPFDWKAQGFLVGQPVEITGFGGLVWTVTGFSDDDLTDTTDNTRMHLSGPVLTAGQITAAPYQTLKQVPVASTVTGGATGGAIVRTDGGNWLTDGFVLGQRVTIDGSGPWTITGLFDDDLDTKFERLLLASGPALAAGGVATRTVRSVVRAVTAGDVPVLATVPITVVGGPYGGFVTRHDVGGSWLDDGFVEGQLVMIQGLTGSWRVRRIDNGGTTLRLERGVELPTIAAQSTRMVFWPGPHGGLTVVHGGGNSQLKINFEMDSTGLDADSGTLRRLDGRSWIDNGFTLGQRVQVGGAGATTWTIVDFVNSPCPFDDPFPGCGLDSTLVLEQVLAGGTVSAGPIPTATNTKRAVHVAEPGTITTTASINVTVQPTGPLGLPTTTLTCVVAGCFGGVGTGGTRFEPGMAVYLSGVAGPFTVVTVTPNALVLQGAALQPTYHIDPNSAAADKKVFTPITLTVWGDDIDRDGGTRLGGDRITVCNLANTEDPCRGPDGTEQIAGPDSPLVVYGDTSQDAVWYGGEPDNVKGHEFGPKPFDPFWKIPEQENEDDEWLFPLANPYDFAGHDVIDASGLFSWITCDAVSCLLPSVGFTAYGGDGDDTIIGSQAGDHLAGGSGDDLILGLRGVDHLYGDGGANVNILTRGLSIESVDHSPAPTLDPRPIDPNSPLDPPIKPGDYTLAPTAAFNRDRMLAGRDEIHGEGGLTYRFGDQVKVVSTDLDSGWPQSAYDDIVFGDHGFIWMDVEDPNEPPTRLQRIQTTRLSEVLGIFSEALQNGDDDTIFGNVGRDVIVAGAGDDMADGDEQDDLVFGDNVTALLRRIGNITSLRFQTLYGGELYTRTDRPLPAGFPGLAPTADTSGVLLANGIARDFRDPDAAPWWAEYTVDYAALHNFPFDDGVAGAGSWGHDYLAGGAHHDLVFGQLGNDIVQGDGSIDSAYTATHHVGASRSPDGCPASEPGGSDPTHAGTCDVVGDLDLIPSFDAAGTDGQDYIEGGGGNDIVLGGLGQDDLVGGSSDFFSLVTPDHRPDGSDLIFGDSGLHSGRNDNGDLVVDPITGNYAVPGARHASDADSIVGDNGRIVRIVGTFGADLCDNTPGNGIHGCDTAAARKYVSFVYDDVYGPDGQIVVRGVTLLDYTPGGPDFRPDRFGLGTSGPCSTSAPETQDGCSELLTVDPGRNDWRFGGWVEIAGNDEVHGGLSDDFIYLGGGNDVAYGDADDDEIIGGWGNDWISGGVGQDAILGDDGRIFASRNRSTGWTVGTDTLLPTNCIGAGTGTCLSEPLNGITAFRPVNTCAETRSVLCGDFLDQYIATPGEVQASVINIAGDLKKMVDLTPHDLAPGPADRPKYDANNSDDVIFGGLGGPILPNYPLVIGHRSNEEPPIGLSRGVAGDFLHGGAGDDAIAGGEAIFNAYTQRYDRTVSPPTLLGNAYRTDWTRPYNPGDLLHFGEDDDAWHDQGPIVNRLGEFALYDEYDPRRTILLNANGTVNKVGTGFQWFLNLFSDEGPQMDGCVSYDPNGTCLSSQLRHSDGSDAIFGDLGNDWMVGGTGQDTMFAGWGNDLLNADDVLTVTAQGQFGDQKGKKIQPSLNDTPDTHPLYQDIAYGGAGLDVLIGNTGGDRLIDWVGEFNSYIVPFSPFGINTVSRQVPPWLYEYLYALSASNGADPTRDEDQNAADPVLESRNGEPHGELGLVTQNDQGLWQDQTGGPSDPQPGNIPGGTRDVIDGADFNDGQFQAFAVDSGVWAVSGGTLRVEAASLGQDAAAVWYHDEYLPVYYELVGRVWIEKPTAGWKANANVIFDYFSPTDFKFAGLDQSINKLVMGYRDASGWHVVAQAVVTGGVRHSQWYDMVVGVNGSTVTVLVNGSSYFTYTFGPRTIDGVAYGLNKGLLGFGSDNSRGLYDSVQLRILPPNLTLDRFEDFADGLAQWLDPETGTWAISANRYSGAATAGLGMSLVDLGRQVAYDAYLELDTIARAGTGRSGLVFDVYSPTDFKYAVIDVVADQVILGHRNAGGWTTDKLVSFALNDLVDHTLKVTLKGASVSVSVDGQTVLGHGFNSALVDGRFGVITTGAGTFDNVRVRTNDPGFDEYQPIGARISITDAVVTEGNTGTTSVALTISLDAAAAALTTVQWVTGPGSALAGSDYVAASGTATFAVGQSTVTINVQVVGDTLVEADETFTVTLSNATAGATIQDGLGVVTIVNNDSAPPPPPPSGASLSIAALTTVIEGNSGGAFVTVTVTRSGSTTGVTTVNWATTPGTATAGSDYTTASGSLSFAAGQTTATLSVRVLGDRTDEPDEDLFVTLSGVAGGSIANGSGRLLIVDNDGAMVATALAAGDVPATPLDEADALAALTAAIRQWVAGGAAANALGAVNLVLVDLPDRQLADADGTTIRLDLDAAGWGWVVGETSSTRIDLLTVLLHELGHVLGHEHTTDGLMVGELGPGQIIGVGSSSAGTATPAADTTLTAARTSAPVVIPSGPAGQMGLGLAAAHLPDGGPAVLAGVARTAGPEGGSVGEEGASGDEAMASLAPAAASSRSSGMPATLPCCVGVAAGAGADVSVGVSDVIPALGRDGGSQLAPGAVLTSPLEPGAAPSWPLSMVGLLAVALALAAIGRRRLAAAGGVGVM